MVYETDFYTIRRPYSRPTITSYTVTGYRPSVWTPTQISPLGAHSKIRLSVLLNELNRIQNRPRMHLSYVPTEDFLNSRPLVEFDDEAKYIRAEANKLMRYIYVPVHTNKLPLRVLSSYDRLTSRGHNPFIRRDKDISNDILNMSYYYEPSRTTIGRGHLACVTFAGGRGYPRRKHLFADEYRDIGDKIKVKSYYNRNVHPSSNRIEEALALPTGFASRLLSTDRKAYSSVEDNKKPFIKSSMRKTENIELPKEEKWLDSPKDCVKESDDMWATISQPAQEDKNEKLSEPIKKSHKKDKMKKSEIIEPKVELIEKSNENDLVNEKEQSRKLSVKLEKDFENSLKYDDKDELKNASIEETQSTEPIIDNQTKYKTEINDEIIENNDLPKNIIDSQIIEQIVPNEIDETFQEPEISIKVEPKVELLDTDNNTEINILEIETDKNEIVTEEDVPTMEIENQREEDLNKNDDINSDEINLETKDEVEKRYDEIKDTEPDEIQKPINPTEDAEAEQYVEDAEAVHFDENITEMKHELEEVEKENAGPTNDDLEINNDNILAESSLERKEFLLNTEIQDTIPIVESPQEESTDQFNKLRTSMTIESIESDIIEEEETQTHTIVQTKIEQQLSNEESETTVSTQCFEDQIVV